MSELRTGDCSTAPQSEDSPDDIDVPMQDNDANVAKEHHIEETQLISVEVDTQATDGYDIFPHRNISPKRTLDKSPVVSNPELRYAMPLDQEEPTVNFKFEKAIYKAPVLRQSLPSAEAAQISLRQSLTLPSVIYNETPKKSHSNNTIDAPIENAGGVLIPEASNENDAPVPAVEGTDAGQRFVLQQKDSNIQHPTNISATRQQKRGITFTAGHVNNDQLPLSSPKIFHHSKIPTAISPPFQNIQTQIKKRRGLRLPKIGQPYSSLSPRQKCLPLPVSEPHARPSSVIQPNPARLMGYEQANIYRAELRQKDAVSKCIDVEGGLVRDSNHMSSISLNDGLLPAPVIKHGPPFGSQLEIRTYSPETSRDSDHVPLTSYNQPKFVTNQSNRAGFDPHSNERNGKPLVGNIPFPDVTCPTNSSLDHDQSVFEINRLSLANKLQNKLDLEPLNRALQNNVPLSSESSQNLDNLKNFGGRHGRTTHPRMAASLPVIANVSSGQLLLEIQNRVETEKRTLSEMIQNQNNKISDLSKQNEDYGERINELTSANDALLTHNTEINGKAKALDGRVKVLLEDHQSVKDFVLKNKSITAQCRQDVQEMKMACNEASNKFEGIQNYHRRVKEELKEATALIHSQKESLNLLRQELDKCVAELQQEKYKSQTFQKELEERRQDETIADCIKSLLDTHHKSVIARLAIQETKLSETINENDRENQKILSDCLQLLESIKQREPQAPKEVVELVDLIESLSTSITERLQLTDDGSERLRNAGIEVMETIKSRVESLLEIQDVKKELDERISSLQVANARLEVTARSHEERIPELQTQLNNKQNEFDRYRSELNLKSNSLQSQLDDKQKELDKCRGELGTKTDELRQAHAEASSSSVSQNELAVLQAVHAKTVNELADTIRDLNNCQTALNEQCENIHSIQAEKKGLEMRLSSAEKKITDTEHELSRTKANASDNLKRQRTEMETDKRKCLESEKRSHVQKVSNLQRLREDAEKMVAELKVESRNCEQLVETKDQLLLALRAEKLALECQNNKQAVMLAQLEGASKSQTTEYHSVIKAIKATSCDITQLELKLKGYEEMSSTNSRIANEIHETVQELIREEAAIRSRLESYEKIEVKVRDYCQKLGMSLGNDTIDEILEQLATVKKPQPTDYKSRSTSTDDELPQPLKGDSAKGLAATADVDILPTFSLPDVASLGCHKQHHSMSNEFTEPAACTQVPRSPEVLDSQVRFNLSPSPLQRRDVRRIAPQRCPTLPNQLPYMRGSYEEVTEVTTKFTRIRESTNMQNAVDVRCYPRQLSHTESRGSVVGDSQDDESNLVCTVSDSSLTDIDPVFDHSEEAHLKILDRQRNKKGLRGETLNGYGSSTSIPKTSRKPDIVQMKKPIKSCLKKTTPRNNNRNWQAMSNDPANASVLKPLSTNPPTSQHRSKIQLASTPSTGDLSKQLPSNNNLDRGGSSLSSAPKQSISSSQSESVTSQRALRKRSISSVSSGPKSEPQTKQARLSIPGRNFHAVPPFFSALSKK